ncbi:hypothetical protein JIX56_01770 [Streptomyces sp. CA-210063]|uniref:hypothetical protein n=1 Tax=Streptomyces sp. CA-210063 TaxID=2801029 RepID=UPI00214C000B|nr:hypothetical protein [Streptomyces sp. CA-210063]UUU28721.1 hypothetical protein JIX56_01770 [Streptomyces sp. CA-210063]
MRASSNTPTGNRPCRSMPKSAQPGAKKPSQDIFLVRVGQEAKDAGVWVFGGGLKDHDVVPHSTTSRAVVSSINKI